MKILLKINPPINIKVIAWMRPAKNAARMICFKLMALLTRMFAESPVIKNKSIISILSEQIRLVANPTMNHKCISLKRILARITNIITGV